jgi:Uma2 family endonuclease
MDHVTAAELEKVITESLADWVERQPGLRQRLKKALETDEAIPVIRSMTYEEFLDWLDEDTVAEWVNGEVVVASPASLVHQDLSSFLEFILRAFTEKHRLGLVVRAPFQMKLSETGREPDLLFINNQHLQRFKGVYRLKSVRPAPSLWIGVTNFSNMRQAAYLSIG